MGLIIVYLLVLAAAFFFLIVRPQRRRAMYQRQLQAAVGIGDEIVTSGGIIATVVGLDEETVDAEIAPGVVVKLARGAIAGKTNPAALAGDDETDERGPDGS